MFQTLNSDHECLIFLDTFRNVLELSYIKSVLERFRLSVFFPSVSSDEETGAKRGSVTLSSHPAVIEILRIIPQLREYPKT